MELARVVGQVVATVKQPGLQSMKLLLLVPVSAQDDTGDDEAGAGWRRQFVAVDYTGAGQGEVVLVARGSAARVDGPATQVPTDAAVVAIVDSVVLHNKTTFSKSG
jgi:ethanolamine utilization protein EutN